LKVKKNQPNVKGVLKSSSISYYFCVKKLQIQVGKIEVRIQSFRRVCFCGVGYKKLVFDALCRVFGINGFFFKEG